jgi:2,4'-dihydroxyacetophenone dioxygenase
MTIVTDPGTNPIALHVGTDDLPYAEDFGGNEGLRLKVLMADVEAGLFVVRIEFAPGVQLPTHLHTGAVHAYTIAGEWSYLEYRESPPNQAGSYLYEPAGSRHTLKVADHNTTPTDAVFVVHGAMVIYDSTDQITAVLDAASHKRDYVALLREQEKPIPRFIEGGRAKYSDGA